MAARLELVRSIGGKAMVGSWTDATRHSTCGQNDWVKEYHQIANMWINSDIS